MKRSLIGAGLALVVVIAHLAAQGGTITGRVLVRERENGDQSLLLEIQATNQVNRVEFALSQGFTFTPGFVPPGWNFTQDKRRFFFTGGPGSRFNARLDARPNENVIRNLQGKELDLQIGTPGTPGATTLKVKVGMLPRVRFRDDWAAQLAHTFPPEFTPGRPLYGSTSPLYTDGVWVPTPREPANKARFEQLVEEYFKLAEKRPPAPAQRIFNWTAIFDEVKDFERVPASSTSAPPRVTYFDQWKERLFEFTPDMKAVPAPACSPGITGGTPMAFTGKDACIQGCFDEKMSDLDKAAAFLLDGTQPVTPQAASPTTVVIRIPDTVTPGHHSLTWSGVPGQLSIRILQVQGTIDQNQLWKGQSTTMRLQILGSDQPIPLKIVNRTPTTIEVEGGTDQVIPSSGGSVNVVNRQVRGIMKGDFTIDYSVDQPKCGR